jgi:hypothetical protein
MRVVEQQIFDNGGYQFRMDKDNIILDVCINGKCFSKEKSVIEFYSYLLKKKCFFLCQEIRELIKIKDG